MVERVKCLFHAVDKELGDGPLHLTPTSISPKEKFQSDRYTFQRDKVKVKS